MARLTLKKRFEFYKPDEETTTVLANGYTQIQEPKFSIDGIKCYPSSYNYYLVGEAIDKLAEYEDAEEQGLLFRLPFKVGDVVYFPIYDYHNSAIIEAIRIEPKGVFFDWVQYEVGVDVTECWDEDSFSIDDIGKTVFATQEEAEAALQKMQEGE